MYWWNFTRFLLKCGHSSLTFPHYFLAKHWNFSISYFAKSMVFEHSKEIFPMTSTTVIKITLLCTVFYNNRCYWEKYRLAVSNASCNTEISSVECWIKSCFVKQFLIDVNALALIKSRYSLLRINVESITLSNTWSFV